jgi:small-conductance mechanosensitive channel
MNASTASPKIAKLLSNLTIVLTTVGLFVAMYFVFDNVKNAVYVVTLTLVGLVGIVSFLRHSVFYRSDQARMGWHQDRPEFQIEVGFANLAVGIAGIVAVALNLGLLACSMCLLMYGTYLACASGLHGIAFVKSKDEKKSPAKVINCAILAAILIAFAVLAMVKGGAI